MKKLFRILLLVAIVGVAWHWFSSRNLDRMGLAEALARYPEPSKWDAAFFLPHKLTDQMLDQFEGASVQGSVGPVGAELKLNAAKVTGDYERATIALTLGAGATGGSSSVEVSASATLSFVALERNASGQVLARFAASVTSLVPGTQTNEVRKPLTPGLVSSLLKPLLEFTIPVPAEFALPLSFDDNVSFETGAAGGAVTVHVKASGGAARRTIGHMAVMFVPSGIWLCVGAKESEKPAKSPSTGLPLAKLLEPYEKQGLGEGKLLLRKDILTGLVNELGAKSEQERTVQISGVSHAGKLYQSGPAEVWLENDSEKATLILQPSATWAADKGIELKCAYSVHTQADLHVHVDPGPTGGIGTSVGCSGDTPGAPTITGTMTTKLVTKQEVATKETATVLLLSPVFPATEKIVATATTDGKLKMKAGGGMISIGVPKFGIKAELTSPGSLIPPLPLLKNKPYPIEMPEDVQMRSGANTTKPGESPPKPCLIIEPTEILHIDEDGYALNFNVGVFVLSDAQIKARNDAIDALIRAESKPASAFAGKITVLMGDLEIGAGNELVKVFMEISKAVNDRVRELEKTSGNVRETLMKAEKDVVDQLNRSSEDVRKQTARSIEDAKREAERFGGNVGRAVGEAGERAARELRNFGRAVSTPFNRNKQWLRDRTGLPF